MWCRIVDDLLIAAALLLLPPLLAAMTNGINQALASVLQQPQLWQALMTSLRIALGAGLLCVALTLMLLWSSRELKLRQRLHWSQTLELSGMVILWQCRASYLTTGFFLLLSPTLGVPQSPLRTGDPQQCADGAALCAEGVGKPDVRSGRTLQPAMSVTGHTRLVTAAAD